MEMWLIDLAKGSNSEHPLPDCQGSHDVSWLHSDREKDCGLKIPLTSTANFLLGKCSSLTSRTKKIFAESSTLTSRTKEIFAESSTLTSRTKEIFAFSKDF